MKKVLVITYYWPPSGGSGVQRWVKFAKYLPQMGWQPVIYTPLEAEAPAVDHSLEEDIPSDIEVIRRPIREYYSLYRKIFKKGAEAQVNPINHQRKSFAAKIAMFLRGNLFVPDPKVTWLRPSVRFLKAYLSEHPVDAIVSTGPPHSMHLIARKVSAETGIPWVADFRDPWTKIFYFKHLPLCGAVARRHRKLEEEVLDGADRIVAVSPLVKEEFEAMTATPVSLITNGFDEEDFTAGVAPQDGFTLTHTGLFASDGNPLALWRAISSLCSEIEGFKDNLCLNFVGKTDYQILESVREAGLSDVVKDWGYLDHSETIRLQLSSTVLLLPLRMEPEYKATLPGKLFEYLAARRPVLAIGQTDGAMAQILSSTGAGSTFDWDDEAGIKAWLKETYESFKKCEDLCPKGDITQFSRRATARSMASLLDSLISA